MLHGLYLYSECICALVFICSVTWVDAMYTCVDYCVYICECVTMFLYWIENRDQEVTRMTVGCQEHRTEVPTDSFP